MYTVTGNTNEDHGYVAVWQSERTNYGGDNCEHYTYHNWNNVLTINKNPYETI